MADLTTKIISSKEVERTFTDIINKDDVEVEILLLEGYITTAANLPLEWYKLLERKVSKANKQIQTLTESLELFK